MTSSQHAPRGDLDLVIVLEVYRRPERRKTWTDPRQPLPQGLSLIVELANLPPGAARMKQYARQLHVSSSELHAAIGFFIRQVFLAPDADHYRVLGLNPGADTGRIKEHYRKLIGRFHPDHLQGRDAWYENYSVRINQAYTVLRNPSKRRAYDTGLRRRGRLDRHRSQHPARAENIRGIRSLSRRTRCIRVRARLALPRRTWQSIKTYASMQLRWRRKTIDIHDPNSAWRRWGLILSVAAIGGCLAFVLNTLVSLHLPSLVNAVRSGLRPPMTSPTSASRTAPAADTRPGLPDPASLSELSPSDTAEHHKPNTPAEHRAAAHGAHSPAAAKSRPRSRTRTDPTVKDNASAPPRPADHHDSASTPTVSGEPEPSGQSPVADLLSRSEADRLLARFLQAYESGNITDFMRLFAARAHAEYRAEYARLFASTTTRRIIFYDFHWLLLGPNGIGEGRFVMTAQRRGETTPSTIRGRLMLQTRKSRQGVLITELLHTYR